MHQVWSKRQVKGCSYEGCTNIVVKGSVCIRYGANVKCKPLCSRAGCTNHVVGRGGVSVWKHGAKVKLCTYKGCTNQSQKGGLGRKHGAYHKLQDTNHPLHYFYHIDQRLMKQPQHFPTKALNHLRGFKTDAPEFLWAGYRLDANLQDSGKGKGNGNAFAFVTEWNYNDPSAKDAKVMKLMLEQIQIDKVSQ